MEIKDIITTDEDRLFIVDSECFILFTGDTLEDEKPFIRIGNWIDMPTELIPLVENIIVPDSLTGSPAFEQFNVDILQLQENRYIGSELLLERFLTFQKSFDLDLSNAHMIKIEKDIPELSSEKNISKKDQFIGVFYSNGNVKILHHKKTFFDLHKTHESIYSNTKKLQVLADEHRYTRKYENSGIIFMGHEPLFYHKGSYYPYFLAPEFIRLYSENSVSPEKIKNIFFPANNFLYLDDLLKWISYSDNAVTVYTDSREQFDLLKNLFPRKTIGSQPFSDLSYTSEDGLHVSQYPGTFNLKFEHYPNIPEKSLRVAYVRSSTGIENILKDNCDLIILTYSVFEDVTLLLKGYDIPVCIAEDANPGIKKLFRSDSIILRNSVQYDYMKTDDPALIAEHSGLDLYLINSLEKGSCERLAEQSNELIGKNSKSDLISLFNLMSLCKYYMFTSSNRDFIQKIRQIFQNIQRHLNRDALNQELTNHKVILCVTENNVFDFIEPVPMEKGKIIFHEIPTELPEFISSSLRIQEELGKDYEKIKNDRERLKKLLSLYAKKVAPKETTKYVKDLTQAIAKRKKTYHQEGHKTFIDTENKGQSKGHGAFSQDFSRKRVSSTHIKNKNWFPLRVLAVTILIALALTFLFKDDIFSPKSTVGSDIENSAQHDERVDIKKLYDTSSETIKKYSISIKNTDILKYVNRVAVKNGYDRIELSAFKKKNPHWIFPGNVFVLHDESRIMVKKGDTLWEIAEHKLISMSVQFYTLLEKLPDSNESEKKAIIDEAVELAFSKDHQARLIEIQKRTKE